RRHVVLDPEVSTGIRPSKKKLDCHQEPRWLHVAEPCHRGFISSVDIAEPGSCLRGCLSDCPWISSHHLLPCDEFQDGRALEERQLGLGGHAISFLEAAKRVPSRRD